MPATGFPARIDARNLPRARRAPPSRERVGVRDLSKILAPCPPCPQSGTGAGPVRGKLVPPFERQSSGSARLVSPASAAIQFWNA